VPGFEAFVTLRCAELSYGHDVRVLGICFGGTATAEQQRMSDFIAEVLGATREQADGVDAHVFEFPDGSRFAVSAPGGMGDTTRSLGFLVDDLDEAISAVNAAGIETDDPSMSSVHRYVHFRAPDGNLYELVERVNQGASGAPATP
jgi:catechol 2,3-dioxygenase-like lactoylglutathione lyase family enzyme